MHRLKYVEGWTIFGFRFTFFIFHNVFCKAWSTAFEAFVVRSTRNMACSGRRWSFHPTASRFWVLTDSLLYTETNGCESAQASSTGGGSQHFQCLSGRTTVVENGREKLPWAFQLNRIFLRSSLCFWQVWTGTSCYLKAASIVDSQVQTIPF